MCQFVRLNNPNFKISLSNSYITRGLAHGYTDVQNMFGQALVAYMWGFGWAWTWLDQTCWDLLRSAANFLHLESELMLTDLTWNH